MDPKQENALMESVKTDITIALPELTSIFVSELETRLYDAKSELRKEVTEKRKELNQIEDDIKKDINFDTYTEGGFPNLNITAELSDNFNISWERGTVSQTVCLKDKASEYRNQTVAHLAPTQDIPTEYVERYKELQEEIVDLTEQTKEILTKITDLPRTERAVRAKISKMKLEQLGNSDLLDNPELQKLIQ